MKTYEEEFKKSQILLFPKLKILVDTEKMMGAYKKRGILFFKNFFRQPLMGH
jgi:hypothetical protein